jgi:hypothetical protein
MLPFGDMNSIRSLPDAPTALDSPLLAAAFGLLFFLGLSKNVQPRPWLEHSWHGGATSILQATSMHYVSTNFYRSQPAELIHEPLRRYAQVPDKYPKTVRGI